MKRLFIVLIFLLIVPVSAHSPDDTRDDLTFDQNLGTQLPLDASFTTSEGDTITIGDLMTDKPAIFIFDYYECQTLCSVALPELAKTLNEMTSLHIGQDFTIISLSINPDETPETASDSKAGIVPDSIREAKDNWYFLTGTHDEIDRLTNAAGFHYAYIDDGHEYAHPTGLVIVTPTGKIARYIYGVNYSAQDVRLGLVDASNGSIGTPVDQFLLLCYRYDPETGRYTPAIYLLLRIAGLATVVAIAGWITGSMLSERKRKRSH